MVMEELGGFGKLLTSLLFFSIIIVGCTMFYQSAITNNTTETPSDLEQQLLLDESQTNVDSTIGNINSKVQEGGSGTGTNLDIIINNAFDSISALANTPTVLWNTVSTSTNVVADTAGADIGWFAGYAYSIIGVVCGLLLLALALGRKV